MGYSETLCRSGQQTRREFSVAKKTETPMIIARGLTKKYDDFVAVDGINFEVKKGESFGLLGPNGAGKSTTMRMIASTSQRTGGELPGRFRQRCAECCPIHPQSSINARDKRALGGGSLARRHHGAGLNMGRNGCQRRNIAGAAEILIQRSADRIFEQDRIEKRNGHRSGSSK